MNKISIVIPFFNEVFYSELGLDYTQKIADSLRPFCHDLEIICVQGRVLEESSNTEEDWKKNFKDIKYQLIVGDFPTRAERLNKGVECSSGDWVLLHHPRSVFDKKSIEYLLYQSLPLWGAGIHQFDFDHPLLKLTSWYSNYIRGKFQQIYYLDHCLIVEKRLLKQAFPIPIMEIFEDTVICKRLRNITPGKLLPIRSTTSSIRFLRRGVFLQFLMNQCLKVAYFFGVSPSRLNFWYEKKLNLNSK